MKIRALFNLVKRKAHSAFLEIKQFLSRKSQYVKFREEDTSGAYEFIGTFHVMEVFLSLLNDEVFEHEKNDPLVYQAHAWIHDLKIAHGMRNLIFKKVENEVPTQGWDAITGLRGKLVAVDVHGIPVSRMDVLQAISDVSVELHDAVFLSESEDAELKKLRAMKKLSQLLRERSERYGNVRNNVDVEI